MAETSAARPLPYARLALIAASAIALIAIAVAFFKGREAPAPPPAAAAPAGDLRTMIANLETKMKASPEDADGWRMLAIGYFEMARYGEAVTAYRRLVALRPNDAQGWSALGEALIQAGDGGVGADAAQAFGTALKHDPKDPRARYFLAVRKDMAGDHQAAVEDWITLLKDTPPGAPWEDSVRQVTEKVAAANKIDIAGRLPERSAAAAPAPVMGMGAPGGVDVATQGIPGPTREQMTAASSLTPAQQDAMVKGMVDGLARRLAADPKDPDGWIRLMRARMVLNDATGAGAALKTAKAANPGDAAKLDEAARTLGVPRV